jgi:hypothetical protein
MADKPAPRKMSEFKTDLGGGLSDIEDQEVVIERVTFDPDRTLNGAKRTLTFITLVGGSLYHSWSEAVARDLAQVPQDSFPISATFTKVRTKAGRDAWVVK